MFRATVFGFMVACGIGAFGMAGTAQAAILQAPAAQSGTAVITVGEGCGAGAWRGPDGRCRPFNTPYGSNRGTRFECPPGWHIGGGGGRCWRN